jgi:asparagine N-glycosylation enzyme membrane subunit Stt3
MKKERESEEIKLFLKNSLSNPKVQWALTLIILLLVIFVSSNIRLSNLGNLNDSTTGEYIPLALDPFYWMRVGQTMITNGGLPAYDTMRYYPGGETAWSHEIMPSVNVAIYKVFSPMFGGTFEFYHVISPVIYYIFGILVFFTLVFIITKKKSLALIASIFLAFNPAYLYRTMAGFADHESIGMLAFFIALLVYSLALYYIDHKKTKLWKTLVYGVAVGFTTSLTIASWGGVANFLFIIIPLSFFLIYLFNIKSKDKLFIRKGLVFYAAWIIFTLVFGVLFRKGLMATFSYFLSSRNIISLAIFGFIIIDALLIYFPLKQIKKQFRVLYTLIFIGVLGFIGLFAIGKNPFTFVFGAVRSLMAPFGSTAGGARLGSTVAENAQPYLADWINQMTPTIFWLSFLGLVLFGVLLAKKIKNLKHSIYFGAAYIFMIFGIIFSKYSASSILNGDNILSQAFYLISLLTFWIYFFYLYINKEFNWSGQDTLIFALMFFTIVSGRAAARVFFLITPFVCLFAAYLLVELAILIKENKDITLRISLGVILILALLPAISGTYTNYKSLDSSAQYTSPSAHIQWQQAMQWVRENTPTDAVFSHWWDYGYWIESLGQRRTIADGGHFQGEFANHRIGRYILTTPNPETAYSMFKTLNTSHLLIDPTDLGKYGAYSKIGGDENWDRFSSLPVGTYNPQQIQETSTQTIIPYNFNGFVDGDILYNKNGTQIFLPGPTFDDIGNPTAKSYIIGFILKKTDSTIEQPEAVYFYNNKQYQIPVRYIYFNGRLMDFGSGLDAVIDIIPSLKQGAQGLSVDQFGAAIYLSPKVKDSLFAQLYLLDDAFGNYEYLTLVHKEDGPVTSALKAQGMQASDFIYYQGIQGTIKIWETNYPADTRTFNELIWSNWEQECYGCLDGLWSD